MTSFLTLFSAFEWWLCGVTFLEKQHVFTKCRSAGKTSQIGTLHVYVLGFLGRMQSLALGLLVYRSQCQKHPNQTVGNKTYHDFFRSKQEPFLTGKPFSQVELFFRSARHYQPQIQPGPVPHLVGNGEAGAQAAGSDCLWRYR